MKPQLKQLHAYPFEKLAALKNGVTPDPSKQHIALSIGEPKHPAPHVVIDVLLNEVKRYSSYPTTKGLPELREAISNWLCLRFQLPASSINPEKHVLPVSGTREALFSFAQCIINPTTTGSDSDSDPATKPLIMMPNPFYQIYEGAALLAGAEPYYLSCCESNDFVPDLDSVSSNDWQRCQLFYLCTPGNPTGSVVDIDYLQKLISLAKKYNFIIVSDECYSEIYTNTQAPAGLLQAAHLMGNTDYQQCVVMHSLSKRSNLPGLRSGFVAGDANILAVYLKYRTYHGCTMPVPTQLASIAAWDDEEHVRINRELYRQKFNSFANILADSWALSMPDAGFYFWAKTDGDDQEFAKALFAAENLTVLPGSFLGRETADGNPGQGWVRMALVASCEECDDAARRIKHFLSKRRRI